MPRRLSRLPTELVDDLESRTSSCDPAWRLPSGGLRFTELAGTIQKFTASTHSSTSFGPRQINHKGEEDEETRKRTTSHHRS